MYICLRNMSSHTWLSILLCRESTDITSGVVSMCFTLIAMILILLWRFYIPMIVALIPPLPGFSQTLHSTLDVFRGLVQAHGPRGWLAQVSGSFWFKADHTFSWNGWVIFPTSPLMYRQDSIASEHKNSCCSCGMKDFYCYIHLEVGLNWSDWNNSATSPWSGIWHGWSDWSYRKIHCSNALMLKWAYLT